MAACAATSTSARATTTPAQLAPTRTWGSLPANAAIGVDLTHLFNSLTGFGHEPEFDRILVAPHALRDGILRLIEGERTAGPGRGRIVMKMNSLVDPPIIDALYEASNAGIEIDLIVRGICCLVPVCRACRRTSGFARSSVVTWSTRGSSISPTALGPGQPSWLVGSADLMPRNLDRRVEVLTPISSSVLQLQLVEILEVNLADDTLAWSLDSTGTWQRVDPQTVDPVCGSTETHLRLHQVYAACRGVGR